MVQGIRIGGRPPGIRPHDEAMCDDMGLTRGPGWWPGSSGGGPQNAKTKMGRLYFLAIRGAVDMGRGHPCVKPAASYGAPATPGGRFVGLDIQFIDICARIRWRARVWGAHLPLHAHEPELHDAELFGPRWGLPLHAHFPGQVLAALAPECAGNWHVNVASKVLYR